MPYLQNGIFPFLRIFALVLVGIILLGTLVWYRKKIQAERRVQKFRRLNRCEELLRSHRAYLVQMQAALESIERGRDI